MMVAFRISVIADIDQEDGPSKKEVLKNLADGKFSVEIPEFYEEPTILLKWKKQ